MQVLATQKGRCIMTSNQIAWKRAQEEERANRAKEAETRRHNIVSEVTGGIANLLPSGKLGKGVKRAVAGIKRMRNINDPAWYLADAGITKHSARVSTTLPNGPFTINQGTRYFNNNYVMLTSDIAPVYGVANGEATDPINVSARGMYSYIRRTLAGTIVGDPNDYMQYVISWDSIIMLWSWAYRALCFMNAHDNVNYAASYRILPALGWDYDDLNENANLLATYLNYVSVRIKNFAFPREMSIFARHAWLFGHVFYLDPIDKSKVAAFNPLFVWEYDWANAALVTKNIRGNGASDMTFSSFKVIMEDLLKALLTAEDVASISSYFAKAYPDHLLELPEVDEKDVAYPVYSEEFVNQFESGVVVPASTYDLKLVQSGTELKYQFSVAPGSGYQDGLASRTVATGMSGVQSYGTALDGTVDAVYLDFDIDNYTELDVITASRLVCTPYLVNASDTSPAGWRGHIGFVDYGTELMIGLQAWYFNEEDGKLQNISFGTPAQMWYTLGSDAIVLSTANTPAINFYNVMLNFSHTPVVPIPYFGINGAAASSRGFKQYLNPHNYTLFSIEAFRDLNKLCTLSLFASFGSEFEGSPNTGESLSVNQSHSRGKRGGKGKKA